MHLSVPAFFASTAALAVLAATATNLKTRAGCFYICPATTTGGNPLLSSQTEDGTLICVYSGEASGIVIACDYNTTTGKLENPTTSAGPCEPEAHLICTPKA